MTFHVHPLLADLYIEQQAAENRRRFERGRPDRRNTVRRGRAGRLAGRGGRADGADDRGVR